MKKLVALPLAILLVMMAVSGLASGIDIKSLSDAELSALQAEVAAELSARKPLTGVFAQVGNALIAIKGARMGKDYLGNDCIVITFEWTHQETDSVEFMLYFQEKVFQGGIQLETAFMVDGMDSAAAMLEIRAGAVLEVEKAYILRDATSLIEIEVKELMAFYDTETLEGTITLPL